VSETGDCTKEVPIDIYTRMDSVKVDLQKHDAAMIEMMETGGKAAEAGVMSVAVVEPEEELDPWNIVAGEDTEPKWAGAFPCYINYPAVEVL